MGVFTLFSKIYAMKTLRAGNFTLEKLRKKLKDLKGKRKEHIASGNKRKMYFISKPIAVAMLYLSGLIC